MSKYGKSSYWLQDWEDDDILVSSMDTLERKSHDIYKLAASKRAISNFVNIVTNQQIPVTFSTRGDSYTDGKSVVIGSNVVEPKDFDIAVGLALHEGSHIKLSNFNVLHDIYNLVPQHIKDGAIKKGIHNPISIIKDLWNVVEDRRIDQYVFNSAPGYRDYYRAMYDKYFNDPLIDKGLSSEEYTEESMESYMFRIINLHNKNTDLSKLKGLQKIWDLIDLKNISRLKSSNDTFEVALDVFKVIMANLPSTTSDENGEGQGENGENQPQNSEGSGGGSNEPREMTDEEFEELSDQMMGSSPMSGDMDSQPTSGSGMNVQNLPQNMEGGKPSSPSKADTKTETVKLSDRQKELLEKKIQKQKEFMNGEVSKKKISKKESSELQTVEESQSELKSVGDGITNGYGTASRVQCVVVRNMTRSLILSDTFPMGDRWALRQNAEGTSSKSVAEGIRIGTMLGKKLQVRGEDRNTVFNRQKHGKIDKRMISSLGFGNENVFQYIETDSYKKANLHISIDASGSMGGSKWNETITNVVALCKAVDMIQNLSIQVSFRSTTFTGGEKPYILLAYDSRKDKFSKVKQLFPYLTCGGTTPEGLCYEAIMDEFLSANNDMDSYFLNISDGDPMFSAPGFYYSHDTAYEHTRKMVKKIESMGIKTMSYFVDGWAGGRDKPSQSFIKMYGAGARKIDVTNIGQITKTMNQLFLQK